MPVDKHLLEQILSDQQSELEIFRSRSFCRRAEQSLIDLKSPQAQVVIGVRRSGKSTLCLQALESSRLNYGYVNFDDERLYGLESAQMNDVLEVLFKIKGDFQHLFLDEVQNIGGWHLFVNRLLRQGMHIILTGSNARLLSTDLATHLAGRVKEITLYPFSFADFCAQTQVDTHFKTTRAQAFRWRAFDSYMNQGGFPELFLLQDRKTYVRDLAGNILKRDIEQRFAITHKATFEALSHHLLNTAPCTVSTADLTKTFAIGSVHTVKNYLAYLQQAYLLVGLHPYSTKSRLRAGALKVYPVDVALMDSRDDAFAARNLGWRLETLVYLQLLRTCKPQGLDIYYYRDRGTECDFLVCRNSQVIQAIQVCYDISGERTRRREIRGLLSAARRSGCSNLLLLTNHDQGTIRQEDHEIIMRPVYDWALDADIAG
jgi:predicted AAA+ superfamily ATPase